MVFGLTILYLAFLLLRPQELYPALAGYQVMDVLGIGALTGSAFLIAAGRRPLLRGPQVYLGVLFLLWSAFTVVAAIRWFGGALTTLFALNVSFVTFLLVVLNISSRRRLAWTAVLVVVCLFVLLGQAVTAYYSENEASPFFLTAGARGGLDLFVDSPEDDMLGAEEAPEDGRSKVVVKRIRGLGFLNDPNDLAQALVSVVPLIFLAWKPRRLFRNVLIVVLPTALLVWGVLLTRSRGGLLALLALAPLALLLRLRPRYQRPAIALTGLLAIPGFVALFGYARADASAFSRIEAWSQGLLMLKSSPIWGVGSGLFMGHHPRVAHSSFVQCFAETGLVGYFCWLGLIVTTLGQLSDLVQTAESATLARWAAALRLSLLGFLVGALFLSRTTSPMFFLVTGLAVALVGLARKDGEEVRADRWWPVKTLALQATSIALVWVTCRAAWG